MKKRILSIILVCALASAFVMTTACSGGKKKVNSSAETVSSVSAGQSSSDDGAAEPAESSTQSSDKESSTAQESSMDESKAESSSDESSNAEEQSSMVSDEESEQESSGEESEGSAEASVPEMYDGYYFDDEQIVEDYHTAEEFTDNEEFNKLFRENDIDRHFQEEIRNAEDESDMRAVTIKYAGQWKSAVDLAYSKLYELLADVPAEQEKLVASQQEWISSLDETENGFRQDAAEEGIQGSAALLAADSAMMNYYKGRTAVLCLQIYILTGQLELG